MTMRSTPQQAPRSARRAKSKSTNDVAGREATARDDDEEADGYDADGGDPETGMDPYSLANDQEGEMSGEAGLSLDTEDLGQRMLESALQSPSSFPAGINSATDGVSEPGGLDLTSNVIDEGSLFDQPRDEGGTRRPAIRTNEVDATLERNQRASRERKRARS